MKRLAKIGSRLAVACLLAGFKVQGADTAKPFESLQPGTTSALTNVNSAPVRKDGLKSFEEEITRSLQPFSARGTLDGVLAPQYRPPPPRVVIPNRRPAKDELDWKNKWNSERDDKEGLGELDPFKENRSDNAREGLGKKRNSLEDFYKEMERHKPGKETTTTRPGRPDDLDLDSDMRLPSSIRESAKSLKEKLFGAGARDSLFKQDPAKDRGSLPDLFSTEKSAVSSREEIQAHKEYIDRFKQILDASAPSLPVGSQGNLNAMGNSSSSKAAVDYNSSLSRLDSFGPAAKKDVFASTPGTVGTVASPTVFPDMNAQLLNQWNPLYTPPKAEPAKPAAPFFSTPTAWDTPRRRF